MGKKEIKTIDDLRELSKQIDVLYNLGKESEGLDLLNYALEQSKDIDEAYHLFFQGELEGYVNSDHEKRLQLFSDACKIAKDDFFLLRNKGASLSVLGKMEEAIECFDKALELNPKDYNAFRQKGVSLSVLGKMEEAIECFDKALELNPKDYNAFRSKGVSLSNLNREEEAIEYYDKAIELNLKDYNAFRQKGVSLSVLGKMEEAIECFDKALELNPKDYNAFRSKGVSLSNLNREEEAIEYYDKAIELNLKDYNAFRQKGVSLSYLNREEEAIEYYDKAIELNPKDYDAFRQKGVSLSILGKMEEAIEYYDKAIELNPKDYDAFRGKGVSLSKLNREEEAIEYYDKAIELNPKDAFAFRSKGISLSNLNREEEAIEYYDKAIELNPKDYDAFRSKGVSLSKLNREEEAIEYYDKAIELNPKDYDAFRGKGVSLGKLGRLEASIVEFDKAIELNPKDAFAFRSKGISLSKLNREEEAIEYFYRALELNPKDYDSLLFLGNIQYRQGKYEHAKQLFNRAKQTAKYNDSRSELKQWVQFMLKGIDAKLHDSSQKNEIDIKDVIHSAQKAMKYEFSGFKKNMKETEELLDCFITDQPQSKYEQSLLFTLRKWNSYTPILPMDNGERSIGGGYFITHHGEGIVIDPGFNFIENFCNAGFVLKDINKIIITHGHNDHTGDLESLLTLFYKLNDFDNNEVKKQRVELYMNLGSFQKFAGFLNLKSTSFINKIVVISEKMSIEIAEGLIMNVLPAYHDEIVCRDYAVGLEFEFHFNNAKSKSIVLTSDTGYYPSDKNGISSTKDKDALSSRYGFDEGKEIDLLILHLGSIKESEIELEKELKEVFYPNHLGFLGTSCMMSKLKPKVSVISEFGEELKKFRKPLMDLFKEVMKELDIDVRLLPADLTFVYDIENAKLYSVLDEKKEPISNMDYDYIEDTNTFYYYSKESKKSIANLQSKGEKFMSDRKTKGFYLKQEKVK